MRYYIKLVKRFNSNGQVIGAVVTQGVLAVFSRQEILDTETEHNKDKYLYLELKEFVEVVNT